MSGPPKSLILGALRRVCFATIIGLIGGFLYLLAYLQLMRILGGL